MFGSNEFTIPQVIWFLCLKSDHVRIYTVQGLGVVLAPPMVKPAGPVLGDHQREILTQRLHFVEELMPLINVLKVDGRERFCKT